MCDKRSFRPATPEKPKVVIVEPQNAEELFRKSPMKKKLEKKDDGV